MTAQEAFSIAFDEAVVLDASPNNPAAMPGAGNMGGGMGGGMGGLGKKPKKEMSMADHMRIYHPHGFDPNTDKCKLFDRMVSNLESQGIDHETAIKRAIAAHNFGSKSTPKGGDIGETKQYSPEQIDDMVNQMVANPSLTLSLESVPLVQPEMIKTVVGEISVETTTQKAIAQVLSQQAEQGNESARNQLQDLIDYQELIKGYEYNDGDQQATTPEQAETFTSEDGSFSISPNERAVAIINADEDGMLGKKELFQNRVNLEAQLRTAKTPEEENDIRASIETINRLFNGQDNPDGGDILEESNTQKKIGMMQTPTLYKPKASVVAEIGENGGNETGNGGEVDDPNIIRSTSGKSGININNSPQEIKEILQQDPNKRSIVSQILDLNEKLNETTDKNEYAEISNKVKALFKDLVAGTKYEKDFNNLSSGDSNEDVPTQPGQNKLTGGEGKVSLPPPKPEEERKQKEHISPENPSSATVTPEEPRKEGGSSKPPVPPSGGDVPPNTPPYPEEQKPETPKPEEKKPDEPKKGGGEESSPEQPKTPIDNTPRDEEFRVGDDKYELDGTRYTDVSGKGLLRGMISSFFAGLRGEGIITGWDRISGRWDAMKRSESGERVRDGITAALIGSAIADYMGKDLSDDARMELSAIQDMFNSAKTPEKGLSVVQKFQKWKDKFGFSDDAKFTGGNKKVSDSMDKIHADGGVLGSGQKIDNEGNIVDGGEAANREIPTIDILGKPGFRKSDGSISWNDESNVENLEEKKEIIQKALDKVSIEAETDEVTPSFNSTFVKFKIKGPIPKSVVDKLTTQLAFDLGVKNEEVSVAVDTKSKQLVVGIRNDTAADISTKKIMESDEWKKACKTMRCPIIIGRTNDGEAVIRDMKDLTHLLIAGDTGKGKSVAMNTILCSMMMAKSPKELKTVLIDLKKVELSRYKDSAHNAVPVATELEDAMKSLEFVKQEMENREKLLEQAGVTNIDDYNAKAKAEGKDTLPTLILGIDELTELKSAGGKAVDNLLKTIGDKGRASGIHMICATQKPTKGNIGEVKTNFPSRLAFPISTREGSESILENRDANSLVGKGEFIFRDEKGVHRGKGSAMADADNDPQRVVDYWNTGKVTPPSESEKPTESEKPSEPEKTKDTEEPKKPESKPEPEKKKKTLDISSRENALASIKAMKDEAIAKADEALAKTGDLEKYEKALDKADEMERRQMNIVNRRFPEEEEDGSDLDMPESGSDNGRTGDASDEADDSPSKIMERAKKRLEREKEKIKKARDEGRLSERKARKQLSELDKRYNDAEAVFNANGTSDAILDALEPEEKTNENNESDSGQSNENNGNDVVQNNQESKESRQEAEKNAALSKTVKPRNKRKNAQFRKLSKKEFELVSNKLATMKDWEVDTDDSNGVEAADDNNRVHVRNPKNGSYGFIDLSDGKFKPEVNTAHPEYEGMRKVDEKWVAGPKANATRSAHTALQALATIALREGISLEEAILSHSADKRFKDKIPQDILQRAKDGEELDFDKESARLRDQANRYQYGWDQAPNNQTIIANAIAEALSRIEQGN